MRYKIFLLIVIKFVSCNYLPPPFKKENYDPVGSVLGYYFVMEFLPSQERNRQCSQPNAIQYNYNIDYLKGTSGQIFCINNKVDQGLIYDAATNQPITTDTLPPGQSFFCKCPPVLDGGNWRRGNTIEDNPSHGTPVTFIKYVTGNTTFDYRTNYNHPDNLYCISRCSSTDLNAIQYQFLKIR